MDDAITTKQLTVNIQENGIIRAPNGRLIARLNNDIKFDSDHLEQSPERVSVDAVVSVLDDCIEDINHELNAMGLDEEKVRMLEEERMYGKIFRKRIKKKLEAH